MSEEKLDSTRGEGYNYRKGKKRGGECCIWGWMQKSSFWTRGESGGFSRRWLLGGEGEEQGLWEEGGGWLCEVVA